MRIIISFLFLFSNIANSQDKLFRNKIKQLENNEKKNFETVFHLLHDDKLIIDTLYQKLDTTVINLFSMGGKYKNVFANRNEPFRNHDDIIDSNIPKYQFLYSVKKGDNLILLFEEHYALYLILLIKNRVDKFVIEWESSLDKSCNKDVISCLLNKDYDLWHEQSV